MPHITVVTGPPAAGKSTFVDKSKADGDVVVDFDRIARALGQSAAHSLDGAPAHMASVARDSVIDAITRGIDSDAWIIQTWMNPERSKQYADADAEIVTVDPGMETTLAQAHADDRPEGTDDEIRRWYQMEGTMTRNKSEGPRMVRKMFAVKADTSGGEGKFTALVNTFNIPDSQNQVMEPGAFAKSISKFSDDSPLPVLWDHQWDDIWAHIGSAKAVETDEGLQIEAQLDMNNPTAQQAYSLLSQHRVHEFSVGGFEDPSDVEVDDDGVEHVKNFDLSEVSLTLKGANPATRLIDVKHEDPDDAVAFALWGSEEIRITKEGRVLASKHVEALKQTRRSLADGVKALDSIIDAVSPPGDTGESKTKASEESGALSMRRRRAFARIHLDAQTVQEENK